MSQPLRAASLALLPSSHWLVANGKRNAQHWNRVRRSKRNCTDYSRSDINCWRASPRTPRDTLTPVA